MDKKEDKSISLKEDIILGYWECIRDINNGLEKTK